LEEARRRSPAQRAKLMEHLEAALALADETKDGVVGYLVESALDQLRAATWPGNLDVPPRDFMSRCSALHRQNRRQSSWTRPQYSVCL
jgi:hypothetical protein